MIKVTKDVINECAKNLMFDLSKGQDDVIYSEFDTILAQIDFLKGIQGVDDAEPRTFPIRNIRKSGGKISLLSLLRQKSN